jgi:hypothetical protein
MAQTLTFGFPNNPRIYCDRPECTELADYELWERDRESYPDAQPIHVCSTHMPRMMEARPRQLRLVKLRVAGDPTQGPAG